MSFMSYFLCLISMSFKVLFLMSYFLCLLCLISFVFGVLCLLLHALCVSLDDIRQRLSFHMSFMSYFSCLVSLMPFITCPTCFIRWHKTTYHDVVHSEIRSTSCHLVLRNTNNVTWPCPQTPSHDVVQFSHWFGFRAMCCRVLHHFLLLQSVAYFVLFPVTS